MLKFAAYFVTIIIFIIQLSACGGGGGSESLDSTGINPPSVPDPVTEPDPDPDPDPVTNPKYSGFNFILSEDDFWEFRWDVSKRVVAPGVNTNATDAGRLRLTLGAPLIIEGIKTYRVIVSGSNKINHNNVEIFNAWQYFAVHENKLLGSKDGRTLDVLFDAMTGQWPANGVFVDFASKSLMVVRSDSISNDYINGTAFSVADSFTEERCEYFPGIGTICTGDRDVNKQQKDYFQSGIGLVGAYYYNYVYFDSATFPSAHTTVQHVGLVASSLRGDVASDDLEVESNDSALKAQPLTLSRPVVGYVKRQDSGSYDSQVESNQDNPDQIVADWYKITIPAFSTYSVKLDFSGTGADIDMYLYDSNKVRIDDSTLDNIGLNSYRESISRSLQAGTYYIGIHAWSTNRKSEYSLEVFKPTLVVR